MVAPADIQAYAGEIARRFRPQKILLFGSHANGTAGPDSDVDLLVVMPHEGTAVAKATEIRCAIDNDFPLDLLVRNSKTLHWRIQNNDWFLKDIVEKGIVLYEAADARVA